MQNDALMHRQGLKGSETVVFPDDTLTQPHAPNGFRFIRHNYEHLFAIIIIIYLFVVLRVHVHAMKQ